MNTSFAQTKLDNACRALLDKGFIQPDIHLSIRANAQPQIYVSWKDNPDDITSNQYKFFFGEPEDAFLQLAEWIYAQPDKATREREQFLHMLASVTEYGRKVGISDDFVNPLVVIAKKLSDNALEGPAS